MEKATFGCLKTASFGSLVGHVPEGREHSFNSRIFITETTPHETTIVLNSGRFPETFLQRMRGALESSESSLFIYQHGLLKLLLCAQHCSQCCKFSGDGRQHIPDFLEFRLLRQWRDTTSKQAKTQRKLQITAVKKKKKRLSRGLSWTKSGRQASGDFNRQGQSRPH